jgi:DNA-binding transcriptional MerR regulator
VEGASVTEDVSQIGRVAETVGLSLRTIRYYEEIGLVRPSGRTAGGFRLYRRDDIDRLLLIKRMKPLGYALEEMAELLELLDVLDTSESATTSRHIALASLTAYADAVQQRIAELESKIEYAHEFHERLVTEIARRSASGPDEARP